MIPIPKKSSHFLTYWNDEAEDDLFYKLFEKSLILLKWRTLKEKFTENINKTQGKL